MISSQEGTEDRRPLAFFLLPGRWRADCSSADSAWAGGAAAGSGSAAGLAAALRQARAGLAGCGGCAGVVVAEAAGDSAVTGAVADALTGSAGATVVGCCRGSGFRLRGRVSRGGAGRSCRHGRLWLGGATRRGRQARRARRSGSSRDGCRCRRRAGGAAPVRGTSRQPGPGRQARRGGVAVTGCRLRAGDRLGLRGRLGGAAGARGRRPCWRARAVPVLGPARGLRRRRGGMERARPVPRPGTGRSSKTYGGAVTGTVPAGAGCSGARCSGAGRGRPRLRRRGAVGRRLRAPGRGGRAARGRHRGRPCGRGGPAGAAPGALPGCATSPGARARPGDPPPSAADAAAGAWTGADGGERAVGEGAVAAEGAVGDDRALRAEGAHADAGTAAGEAAAATAHSAAAHSRRRAEAGRERGDGRLARQGDRLGRQFGLGQRQAGGVVVVGHDVAAAGIEDPLGDVQPAAGREREGDLPVAVAALAGVPLPVLGVRAGRGKALGHDVAEPRAWTAGVARPAHRGGLGLVGDVGALGQDRAFEPAHALDRDAGGIGDLLRRLAGADSCLDLLGSQRTLHFDLVLGEPGGLAHARRPAAARRSAG